jgi:hypothetical protein
LTDLKICAITVQAIQTDNSWHRGTIQTGYGTVYSIGGSGVSVGVSVGRRVSVGVSVIVTVSVGLGIAVLSGSFPVPFNVTNNASAPTTRNTASKPSATGRLRVTSGIRAPWTVFSDLAFGLGVALNSLPHTTQREAFSASRVPQVGQSLEGVVSGLIAWDYTMRRNGKVSIGENIIAHRITNLNFKFTWNNNSEEGNQSFVCVIMSPS